MTLEQFDKLSKEKQREKVKDALIWYLVWLAIWELMLHMFSRELGVVKEVVSSVASEEKPRSDHRAIVRAQACFCVIGEKHPTIRLNKTSWEHTEIIRIVVGKEMCKG